MESVCISEIACLGAVTIACRAVEISRGCAGIKAEVATDPNTITGECRGSNLAAAAERVRTAVYRRWRNGRVARGASGTG